MNKPQHLDTYFLDSKTALKNALQNNEVLAPNGIVKSLQICYYDGKKIENAPINCIHVPFDSILEYFSTTKNRLPKTLNCSNTALSSQKISALEEKFKKEMDNVNEILNKKIEKLHNDIRNLKPNFKDEKLRIFAHGCRETVLIKHLVKNILDAANVLGYETYLHTQPSELESCSEVFYLEALKDFNPHITININHLNNHYISDDVFNFVWFQDLMPSLTNHERTVVREKDYVFSLTEGIKQTLDKKNIPNEIMPFMINENLYKARNNIKKEKKVVFVGSSYAQKIESIKYDADFNEVYNHAVEVFEQNSYLSDLKYDDSTIRYLMHKFNKSSQYIGSIYGYLIRDYCVEKLCKIDTDYEIEVYGHGWRDNSVVAPYFKGYAEYGEDISKIYNSATYGYCPGGYVLMQRTLECAFSETIPLVLDVRADKQDVYDKRVEDGIEFFHIKDLENILKKDAPTDKSYDYIKEHYSYKRFVSKCINIIKKTPSTIMHYHGL